MSKSAYKSMVAERRARIAQDRRWFEENVSRARKLGLERVFNAIHKLEPKATMFIGIYSVELRVPVKSFKHILEVLEFIGNQTGLDFDHSEDYPYGAERTYYASGASWLKIVADASGNEDDATATCRRRIVSYKTQEVPVYELECAE